MDEGVTRRSLVESFTPADPSLLARTLRDVHTSLSSGHSDCRLVGGYALLEEIGQGGMGLVYKARQVQLDRLVALKMLRPGCASREDLMRFRIEAEAVAHLIHPGIVQIHEIGEHEGHPFLSLEYVAGGNLDRHLAGAPLAPAEAAGLVHALAEAIDFAHGRGVIHRDLKPANILLSEEGDVSPAQRKSWTSEAAQNKPAPGQNAINGRFASLMASPSGRSSKARFVPKITDFGLAKRLDGTPGQTRDGEVVGTPAYMAPEQAEGRKDIGPAADIYALGAILYECLTGRPPFLGDSLEEILRQVRADDPVPPRRLVTGVPRDVETICLKCLAKTPSHRYASAMDLAEDLARFLGGEPIRARAVGRAERIRKWASRRPTAAALCVVSGLFVAVLLAAGPIHIARLRGQVEEESRKKIEAHEALRRAELRGECQRHLAAGRSEFARGDLAAVQSAEVHFATALESITDADAGVSEHLAHLRRELSHEQGRATRRMHRLLGAGPAREELREQEKLRDEAFFQLHRDLLGGPDRGQPRASLEAGRKALEIKPDLQYLEKVEREKAQAVRQEVLLLVAEAMVRLDASPGELRQALALVEEAERVAGPRRAVSLRRARYLEKSGDAVAAARERLRAAAQPARDAMDSFLIAQEHWLAGNLLQALEDLEQVLRHQPRHFWARLLRAVAWQRLGQPADARAELSLCIQDRPDFAWPYLLRAPLWLSLPQGAARARADLDSAAKMPLDRSARYLLYINRGIVAINQRDTLGGVRAFQYAVLFWPDRYFGHANLAQAYWDHGQQSRALASLDYALRLAPLQSDLYRTRGRMHAGRGDHRLALADIEQTLQLAPANSSNASRRAADLGEKARLLYRLRRHGEALLGCRQALQLRPNEPSLLRLHAEVLLELHRPGEALVAFNRFLKFGSPDVEFYRRRARARAATGDLTGVVDDFTLALALRRDAPLLTGKGWAHLVAGAAKPALHEFDAALRLQPTSADARVGRATALLELGQREKALAEVEEVLKRETTSSRVLYKAARVLARGVTGAQPRQVRRQQERALDVLRRAVRAVPEADRTRFWKEQVCRDGAFRPLRGLAAFSKFQAEIVVE